MAQPRFEVALGAIDGSNKTFTVSVPYSPNTTSVFINGKMYRRDWADGWAETNPATGRIDLNDAPLLGDVVQVFFTDTTLAPLSEEITPMQGTIRSVSGIRGSLTEIESRTGTFRP